MASPSKTFNFNIGILGHVDSGKTSLAKSLSTLASTAAFDKNPQSQERGITLDLGFSSFSIDFPACLKQLEPKFESFERLQFTLVDCPGHASLIRTIIGGAQIIDLMILVIDVMKGVQTQTAECLVLGEITCPHRLVVVLNKIDLLAEEKRQAAVDKMSLRIRKTLESTTYKSCPIVAVAAKTDSTENGLNLDKLVETLVANVYFPNRSGSGPLLFAVDHCFAIRGQGTVMTGTVLAGSLKTGDTVEIPSLKESKKIKSIQMFKQPVNSASQGDRVGICVTQFESKLFERGIVCQPGSVALTFAAIVSVAKIPYYKGSLESKTKFHVTIGYETVLAKCDVFGCCGQLDSAETNCGCCLPALRTDSKSFNFDQEYKYQSRIQTQVSSDKQDEQHDEDRCAHQYLLMHFEQPVLCPPQAVYIASKFDMDIHANACRLAFHGVLLHNFCDKSYSQDLSKLKIFKRKKKEGVVERMQDEYTVIAHSLFKKETDMELFRNLRVTLSTGEAGVIEGSFGQSGKVKIRIPTGLSEATVELLQKSSGERKKGRKQDSTPPLDTEKSEPIRVTLAFKQYLFSDKRKIIQ